MRLVYGVLEIQGISHFTSRDFGYYSVYFHGYGILCSIFVLLLGMLAILKNHWWRYLPVYKRFLPIYFNLLQAAWDSGTPYTSTPPAPLKQPPI